MGKAREVAAAYVRLARRNRRVADCPPALGRRAEAAGAVGREPTSQRAAGSAPSQGTTHRGPWGIGDRIWSGECCSRLGKAGVMIYAFGQGQGTQPSVGSGVSGRGFLALLPRLCC